MMEKTINIKEAQIIELDMLKEMDRICKKNNLIYYLAYGTALGAVRHKGFIPWDDDIDIIVDIDSYKKFCDTIHNEISDKYVLSSMDWDSSYDLLMAKIGLKNQSHHSINLDIFPIVGVPRSKVGRIFFSNVCRIIHLTYFYKKVNIDTYYKKGERKRTLALIKKLLFISIPASLIKLIFYKLSKLYPIDKSDTIFSICGCYRYKELIPKQYLGEPVLMEFEGIALPVPRQWDAYLTHLYGDYMTPLKTIH
jgi:lipopolysaccharide cholinephosphotransferase